MFKEEVESLFANYCWVDDFDMVILIQESL